MAATLYQTLKKKNVEAVIAQYKELKKTKPKAYNFNPRELNRLGYHLMQNAKDIKGAVKIFKFNVEVNPKYANGYDSLGEAYLEQGKKNLAIKNFAKALSLNPQNPFYLEKLNKVMKDK